jgi:DNA-binding transcriptional MerR regulator/methylmalonyl-CoA mutase cobalamin-binding subunit
MTTDIENSKILPIGYVARVTGLTAHVIRAWERRYGIVEPERTANNRRMYSRQDVARIDLCRKAVRAGHSIGQLAGLASEAIQSLIDGTRINQTVSKDSPQSQATPPHVDACLQAAVRLDERGLESGLRRAAAVLPRISLLDDVIAPLLGEIGRRWASGSLNIVHEHMTSSVIQSYLLEALRSAGTADSYLIMVAATPAGQWCQLGALMACVAAADTGWKPIYFGPSMPAAEIVAAASHKGAQVVALSIAYRTDDNALERELDYLQKKLPPDVRLFLGGGASVAYRKRVRASQGRCFDNLKEFAAVLSDMESVVRRQRRPGSVQRPTAFRDYQRGNTSLDMNRNIAGK